MSADICGPSTAVVHGYAGSVRRLELAAKDNIAIFDATSAHQWIFCCAEPAPVAPGTSLFSGVTTTCRHCAGFQHVEYLPASSTHRNRAQTAQPTQLDGRADTSSVVYCRKLFARKVQWAHCVFRRHLYCTNGEVAVSSVLRRNIGASVAELMTSATMFRLRRW